MFQHSHYRGSRKRRERRGSKNVFEAIMAENFPNLKKENYIQVWEAQRVQNKMNRNRPIPGHIIIKMAKVKERILKEAREKKKKKSHIQGNPQKAIS